MVEKIHIYTSEFTCLVMVMDIMMTDGDGLDDDDDSDDEDDNDGDDSDNGE